MVPVFKNVGEWATAKNHCPVILLSVVSRVSKVLFSLGTFNGKQKTDHIN